MASGAFCQVIELEPDGSKVTFSRPMILTPEGARAIAPRSGTVGRTAAPAPVMAAIRRVSQRHDIATQLVEAVARAESNFRQDAVSPKGARGVMQLMPATARALRVDAGEMNANIEGGAAYLSALMRRYDGDLMRALAAYNAGPGAVERQGGVPAYPETQAFVGAILERLAAQARQPAQMPP